MLPLTSNLGWIFWLIVANIGIFFTEASYRQGGDFLQKIPMLAVPIIASQYSLFKGFSSAPSLLVASATFTLLNVALRLVNVHRLGEELGIYQYTGVVLIMCGVFLVKGKA